MVKNKEKRLMKLTATREDKALQLFQIGAVTRKRDDLYCVRSQKDAAVEYEVIPSLNVCTCVDLEKWSEP